MLVTLLEFFTLVRLVHSLYPLLVDYQYYAVIKVEINGDAFRKPFYS